MSGQECALDVWLDCDLGSACQVGTLAQPVDRFVSAAGDVELTAGAFSAHAEYPATGKRLLFI